MDRKEAILTAALEAFDATGETAIDEIRRRSGASVGSIYHHFGDKRGIAAALYVEILRGYLAGMLRVLRRADDAEQGVKALVRHHLRWVERNPQRARFLLKAGEARAAAGEELKQVNASMYEEVGAWIARQKAIRSLRWEVFFAIVFGPAQELARSWLAGRAPSLRKVEDELADAAWRGIRATG